MVFQSSDTDLGGKARAARFKIPHTHKETHTYTHTYAHTDSTGHSRCYKIIFINPFFSSSPAVEKKDYLA